MMMSLGCNCLEWFRHGIDNLRNKTPLILDNFKSSRQKYICVSHLIHVKFNGDPSAAAQKHRQGVKWFTPATFTRTIH